MPEIDADVYRMRPNIAFKLEEIDAEPTKVQREHRELIEKQRDEDLLALRELHERLFASKKQSLLICMLAIDTGGKDSTINRIFSGLNPQGCDVTSYGVPSEEELSHDFLWRIHKNTPPKGRIGIFNRSQYEDVTVQRVHKWVDEDTIRRRYQQIIDFEEMLTRNGTDVIKFHLRITKDEQKERLEDRLNDHEKYWKFNPSDLRERGFWDDYQDAFERAIAATSTKDAPWYVVPANSKWLRDAIVVRAVVARLQAMNPQYPPPAEGIEDMVVV